MKISVVMPVYEPEPEFLRAAVASVLAQTHADLELIVVEDPGSRSAAAVLEEFGDARVRHLRNARRTSFAAQLNRGFAEAAAPWVARMDADDLCEPDRLEKQVAFLRQHAELDLCGSQLMVIDERGNRLGYRAYPTEPAAIRRAMSIYCAVAHPSVICRRETVVRAGGYCGQIHPSVADYELWCRLISQGAKFGNHPLPLLRYRLHRNTTKTQHLRATLRGSLEIKRRYWPRPRLSAWFRVQGERLLLRLPPSMVMKLFVRLQVRQGLPEQSRDNSLPRAA